jgi:hypothetical protein
VLQERSAAGLAAAALVLALAAALPASASADTFTVTNPDEGSGSLRDEVTHANAHPGHDEVDFAASVVANRRIFVESVTLGDIKITGDLDIDGPGADQLTVSSLGGRAFSATDSANATISGLTLEGLGVGSDPGQDAVGGTILNRGTLALSKLVVQGTNIYGGSGGAKATGGAIFNSGALTVADSTFTSNAVNGGKNDGGDGGTSSGGAIANSGTLIVSRSFFKNNIAQGGKGSGAGGDARGGAIQNTGVATLIDSTLASNFVEGGEGVSHGGMGAGGGIFNNGELHVFSSTFKDNLGAGGPGINGGARTASGVGAGGGIENLANFRLENSTLSGNSAVAGEGTDQHSEGGGIDIPSSSPDAVGTITSSTIAGNAAQREGGFPAAGGNMFSAGNLKLKSTIVSNPVNDAPTNCNGIGYTSLGYNLESKDTCFLRARTDQTNKDPNLGPLQDNGGPTNTRAIPLSSPTLDQGISDGLTTDQRGSTRPVRFPDVPKPPGGNGADIGAFEVQSGPAGVQRRIVGSVHPHRTTVDDRTCFRFDAEDESGEPLRNVRIRFGGKHDRTGRDGGAKICKTFQDAGARHAHLTKRTYERDRLRVSVQP